MASKTISAAAKRAAVVRIAAARQKGENIIPAESARLKVTPQAIRGWCREAGVDLKGEIAPPSPTAAGGSSPPPAADPSPAGTPRPGDPAAVDALKEAHELAGTGSAAIPPEPSPASPSAPITPKEVARAVQEASVEDKAFVVDTLEDFKKMVVGFAGPVLFKIPQEDPVMVKISGFGPLTRNVLRANAGVIAPDMRATIARGWDIVFGAVLLDLSFTTAALMERRKELQPAKREEPEERKPAREEKREEAPAPAAAPADRGVWKPGDGPPPPPPAGAVVTK